MLSYYWAISKYNKIVAVYDYRIENDTPTITSDQLRSVYGEDCSIIFTNGSGYLKLAPPVFPNTVFVLYMHTFPESGKEVCQTKYIAIMTHLEDVTEKMSEVSLAHRQITLGYKSSNGRVKYVPPNLPIFSVEAVEVLRCIGA